MSQPVSKAACFGIYALTLMARARGKSVSASEVARTFNISEAHVAKVLQQLVRSRLVRGTRGVGGGYQLVGDPAQISMLDVVECIDGPRGKKCETCAVRVDGDHCSPHPVACAVQSIFSEIDDTAYYTMKSVTLATLAASSLVPLRKLPIAAPRRRS